MNINITELISSYLYYVNDFVATLRIEYGVANLLRARRDRVVPSVGKTANGKYAFRFHGVGCEVVFQAAILDFDFDEHGSVDGFDAYRLSRFANSKYCSSDSIDEDTIQVALESLLKSGTIVSTSPNSISKKYRLADSEVSTPGSHEL